jgi:hypothetical protein
MLLKERPILGKEAHEWLGQHERWHTAVGLSARGGPAVQRRRLGWLGDGGYYFFLDFTASLAFIGKIHVKYSLTIIILFYCRTQGTQMASTSDRTLLPYCTYERSKIVDVENLSFR